MVEDQIADGTAFCRCTEHDPGASSVEAGGVLTRESAGGAERLLL